MVPLSLSLSSVVRRFDLLGLAKYFFIPYKGTSKTQQTTRATKQQHKYNLFKHTHTQNKKKYRAQQQTGDIDIKSIIRQNNTGGYRNALSNKQTDVPPWNSWLLFDLWLPGSAWSFSPILSPWTARFSLLLVPEKYSYGSIRDAAVRNKCRISSER